MNFKPLSIAGVTLIEPTVLTDNRGGFWQVFNEDAFAEAGLPTHFVQHNQSFSNQGVLRGIHFQLNNHQGKLIRVVSGEIFDVAIDLRQSSPTFKQWIGVNLSAENRNQLWVPGGLGHAFYVLSSQAEVIISNDTPFDPENAKAIRWNDPDLNIDWPLNNRSMPTLSDKDASAPLLSESMLFA